MARTRERRSSIVELVEQQEEVEVAALAAQFGLTPTSIRRDLLVLEGEGRLKRVRGGAIARTSGIWQGVYAAKLRQRSDDKTRIAAVAAALVTGGEVVLFDSGTTVARVAAHVSASLRVARSITVVTNSVPVIEEVETWEGPHLIDLGGLYLPEYRAFVGPQTLANLHDLSADIAFIGCDGLSLDSGLTTPHVLVAEVGAAAAGRARLVVVVADSSKLGRQGLTPIIPLTKVDVLVTDTSADPGWIDEIRAVGVQVLLA